MSAATIEITPGTASVPKVHQRPIYYTSIENEKHAWFLLNYCNICKRRTNKILLRGKIGLEDKKTFRERRSDFYYCGRMTSLRIHYENNNEIGAFLRLTNAYALVGAENESKYFSNAISGDLNKLPVISTTLTGCNIVGRMCVGNKNGLLVHESVYDSEFEKIENELPDSVKMVKMEERLSALGNVIACNDRVALIHPELNKESEEIIADTLQVEVFRSAIGNNPLVGSYCVLNNNGGLVHPEISNADLENLSSLLQIPLGGGTVNGGCTTVGSGLAVNDRIAYTGMKTMASEFSIIDSVFQFPTIQYREPNIVRTDTLAVQKTGS